MLAGSRCVGQCCSKHFPLDVGFLLCLAATEGCLNFSQRQIFIHQSMQCSTGPACEREARGVLRRWSGGSLFNCTRGVAKREPPGGRGGGVGFETPVKTSPSAPGGGDILTGAARLQFLLESLQLIFSLERCQAFDSA